jgi:hypothetical protein
MKFDALKDHVNQLISYNWDDEWEDYKANPDPSHIFHTLVDLDNYFNGFDMTADQHISGEFGERSRS